MPSPQSLLTETMGFRRVLSTNSTDDSFTSRIPKAAVPRIADTGVFSSRVQGSGPKATANTILILPFGTNAAGEKFDMRVYGWREFTTGTTPVWIPFCFGQFACEEGGTTGVDGSDMEDENFFCDTISKTDGTTALEVISYTDNRIGMVAIDFKGFDPLTIDFDIGTAASANALYTFI